MSTKRGHPFTLVDICSILRQKYSPRATISQWRANKGIPTMHSRHLVHCVMGNQLKSCIGLSTQSTAEQWNLNEVRIQEHDNVRVHHQCYANVQLVRRQGT